jgi:hypothetical protein
MSKLQRVQATKKSARLKAALYGPSGSGKTFTALRVATGLANGGPITVIDTEHESSTLYADKFDFGIIALHDHSIESYIEAIYMSEGVLVIDSLTHAWQDLRSDVDKLANTKFRGNSWSAWSEGTPRHRALIDAMLAYPGHLIATMRTKTEWHTSAENGKTKIQRVGLAPEQRAGMEYEFSVVIELSVEHYATVVKDRSDKFQDQIIHKPGESFGRELREWLQTGVVAAADSPPVTHGPNSSPVVHMLDAMRLATNPSGLKAAVQGAAQFSQEDQNTITAEYKRCLAALRAQT